MKKCTRCGILQHVNEFHAKASNPDGLQSHCKKCRASHSRKYLSSPEIVKKRESEAYKKRKREANAAWRTKPGVRERLNELQRRRAKIQGTWDTPCREISRKYADRNGVPWTADEENALLAYEGDILDFAIDRGRTHSAVASKLKRLRKELHKSPG